MDPPWIDVDNTPSLYSPTNINGLSQMEQGFNISIELTPHFSIMVLGNYTSLSTSPPSFIFFSIISSKLIQKFESSYFFI